MPPAVSEDVAKETKPGISRRRLIAQGTLALAALACGDAFGFEPRRLDFEQTVVPIHGLDRAFDGYRIALLSDFHLPYKSSRELVQEACSMAMAFRPDVIALTGDFVHKVEDGVPSFAGYFDTLKASDGVFATLGNHDHWVDAQRVRLEILEHTPARLIEQKHVMVRRGGAVLAVGGVGDLMTAEVNPDKAFKNVPPNVPRILLSHNPDIAEKYPWKARVDLQLSGHTHGGEICFPNGYALDVPSQFGNKFRAGLCEGAHHRVYVTRGVCTVLARLFCRPEVTGIILRAA
jgi:hypothetical protein